MKSTVISGTSGDQTGFGAPKPRITPAPEPEIFYD